IKWADFNPSLQSNGHIGYPGLKIRVNGGAFRYASTLISQMINQEVPKVRIPPFSQCLPEVNGCAYLSNIMITKYQCAQRVTLSPVPYDRIQLSIENVAIRLNVFIPYLYFNNNYARNNHFYAFLQYI
ncbi:unnamed protein product, partial [Gongylonema pulchrum]|uniref:PKD_channel domain-containing protein n=1 Tax=Gongylonema pulchrum TaxID=637853 RepID=A0A183DCM8_9BILA